MDIGSPGIRLGNEQFRRLCNPEKLYGFVI